jgi:hypothetical protein
LVEGSIILLNGNTIKLNLSNKKEAKRL